MASDDDPKLWPWPMAEARAMLRFLTLELPGGERSLDNDAFVEAVRGRHAKHPLAALQAEVMRRRRKWRRRRTLLLLRRLSDLRAIFLSVAGCHGPYRL